MFVDSHAHLEMEQFNSDREQMLARARETGVQTIVAIGSGTGPGTYDCAIKIAEQQHASAPELFATLGVHPHEANLVGESDFHGVEGVAGVFDELGGAERDQARRDGQHHDRRPMTPHAAASPLASGSLQSSGATPKRKRNPDGKTNPSGGNETMAAVN